MVAMARFLTALIVVASLFAVPASAQNFNRGYLAYSQGDFATALREWLPLARRGSTLAQYNLGRLYFSGEGVAKDYTEAVKWFNVAADLGEAAAPSHRDVITGLMTSEEIAKAREMANLWLLKNRR